MAKLSYEKLSLTYMRENIAIIGQVKRKWRGW